MVALVQRFRKLEKKVADQSQIGHLDDRVEYRPSAEELAEAVAILIECGAVRVVGRYSSGYFSACTGQYRLVTGIWSAIAIW